MLCKIYIQHSDKKLVLVLRQTLFMCGARFATNIRFVDQPNDADIWIMPPESDLLSYAKKRASTHYLSLWVCDDKGSIYDIKNTHTALTTQKISQIIDVIALQLHKKADDKTIADTVDANNTKLIKYLRLGFEQQRGKLFLQYKEAQLLIDFEQDNVKANAVCQAMLNDKKQNFIDFTAFEILPAPTDESELTYHSSAFAIGWRIMQNSKEQRLIISLSSDTPLKLKQWPSFEHVEHDFEDYRIASFLQKRAFSASQIINLLKLPEQQVFAFFNAVYITGIANAQMPKDEPDVNNKKAEQKPTNSLVGLWRKVRASFSAS